MNDQRGSIWRKWDLHVHTPESYQNRFGDDWDDYVAHLKNKAVEHDVEVMGVTDYFSVNGYEKLKSKYGYEGEARLHLSNGKFLYLLPCIELRIDAYDQYENSINLHVIFSPKLQASTIRSSFLDKLKVKYRGVDLNCKKDDLIKIGHAEENNIAYNVNLDFSSFSEAEKKKYIRKALSFITLSIDDIKSHLENLKKDLISSGVRGDCFLFLVAYKGHGSLSNLPWAEIDRKDLGRLGNQRQNLLNFADMCFSNHPGDKEFLLGNTISTPKLEFINRFRTLKPCVWGSDAHNKETIFHPSNGASLSYTWIKSDPTFEGLLQVINEPEDRIYIGEKPSKLISVEENKTKYIKSLKIHKKSDSKLEEYWFDNSLELNNGLVAIIGNKGSGKSAIADILGLLANSIQTVTYFSFLNDKRFKQKRLNKAVNFVASIEWLDGVISQNCLNDNVDFAGIERVRYLPQNYIETICNEMISNEESIFYKELKKVIFSYISESDRLYQDTLDNLLRYKTQEIEKSISFIRSELHNLNTQILSAEEKSSDFYLETLSKQLGYKERELKIHDESKPVEVKKPENDPVRQKELHDKSIIIEKYKTDLEILEKDIENAQKILRDIDYKISLMDNLIEKINNFKFIFDKFRTESMINMEEIGIKFDQVVSFKLDMMPLNNLYDEYKTNKEACLLKLSLSNPESKTYKKNQLEKSIKILQSEMDKPNREYQGYLNELKKWEDKRKNIVGNKESIDTLEYIKYMVEEIGKIPQKLSLLRQQRLEKTNEIFEKLASVAEIYSNFYSPIQAVIQRNDTLKDRLNLNMDVSINIKEQFVHEFLGKIKLSVRSSFYSKSGEGEKLLRGILDKYDFNIKEDVNSFLNEIIEHLIYDKRQVSQNESINIANIIKSDESVLSLYDYIFSLGYLEPKYQLKLYNKELSQLSPGERGSLLLVFYLLLDKDDKPLIIDQPEENLDNQTIYNLLVPSIRKAKEKRQILIITHNPNLAVVCDAEQIICASIDKANGYRIRYISGSIENIDINKHILNILEGTRPAFKNRDSKYLPETAI